MRTERLAGRLIFPPAFSPFAGFPLCSAVYIVIPIGVARIRFVIPTGVAASAAEWRDLYLVLLPDSLCASVVPFAQSFSVRPVSSVVNAFDSSDPRLLSLTDAATHSPSAPVANTLAAAPAYPNAE